MCKIKGQKLIVAIIAGTVSLGLVSALLKAGTYIAERKNYIEVGGSKPVYVPRTATYVKYNGNVVKIAKFAAAFTDAEEDCRCPKCCNGYCYIIIWTDPISVVGPIRILSIIWIPC